MSKMLADRMMLDFQGVVLAMMDAAEAYQTGDAENQEKAQLVLSQLGDGIARMKQEYLMMDSMKSYYGSELTVEALHAPLQRMKEGQVAEALSLLESLMRRLTEVFSGGRRKEIHQRQSAGADSSP